MAMIEVILRLHVDIVKFPLLCKKCKGRFNK